VRGFREILDGKHDDLPEQAFYMVGTIEEGRGAERMRNNYQLSIANAVNARAKSTIERSVSMSIKVDIVTPERLLYSGRSTW
jgi:hypothetical protein